MNKLFKVQQIFAAEDSFFAKGNKPIDLMLLAAKSSANWLAKNFPANQFVFLIGPGNNGADGLHAANFLINDGYEVRVLDALPHKSKSILNTKAWEMLPLKKIKTLKAIPKNTVMVDAVFGIGGKGIKSQRLKNIIKTANAFRHRVSIDVPTGIDLTNDGLQESITFAADFTLTFLGLKEGFYGCSHNSLNTGKIVLLELNKNVLRSTKSDAMLFDFNDVRKKLPERVRDSHKGKHGKMIVLAGDEGMGGAGILTAMSALHSGTGLIKLLTRNMYVAPALSQIPEVMVTGGDTAQDLEMQLGWEDILVVGPGFFENYWSEQNLYKALGHAKKAKSKLVIDAGALGMLVNKPFSAFKLKSNTVLTPHPGEAASLLNTSTEKVQQNRIAAAKRLHKKYGCIIVLKGMETIIADKDKLFICENGSPSLATPGSGDVLAGLIGSLMAQGLTSLTAAKCAVAVHGLAGEILEEEIGTVGVTAQDIIGTVRSLIN